MNSIFTLNLNEIEVLSSLIEFLHSNQLIKKIEQKLEPTNILTKINTIFNTPQKKFTLRKFQNFGFNIFDVIGPNFNCRIEIIKLVIE